MFCIHTNNDSESNKRKECSRLYDINVVAKSKLRGKSYKNISGEDFKLIMGKFLG